MFGGGGGSKVDFGLKKWILAQEIMFLAIFVMALRQNYAFLAKNRNTSIYQGVQICQKCQSQHSDAKVLRGLVNNIEEVIFTP